MTQIPSGGPVVQVKPQPNVYTVLLVVTIIVLAVTIGLVLHNLMSPVTTPDGSPGGYGLSFGDLFKSLKDLVPTK